MLAPGSYLIESSLRTIEEALMGDPIPALIAKQPEGGPSLHIVPESSANCALADCSRSNQFVHSFQGSAPHRSKAAQCWEKPSDFGQESGVIRIAELPPARSAWHCG